MNDHIADAQQCVDDEYQATDDRLSAIERFLSRVSSLQTVQHTATQPRATASGHTASHTASAEDDACRTVRTIFDETIGAESTQDLERSESVVTTMSEELSEPVAFALAPGSNGSFTDEVKQAVLSRATSRKTETKVLKQVLEQERSLLAETRSLVEELSATRSEIDSESFETLSFPELQAHHEILDTYRTRCDEFLTRRQSFLQDSTARLPHSEITHRTFVLYLYQDLELNHPILATIADCDDSCAATQWEIRNQLVRTV
ncbi:hypothetical protein SAMN04487948_10155 [Halogranum amylolyticum]|uniref:DUF7260 domain-containing protein n=1 Tax=Halogranum amylolyticum TaxID=660520 RepID=A0A1H8MSF4_9EURY|nr:hypothetical protein SAMN04487948_10155 [Halogranum amylolyticum]